MTTTTHKIDYTLQTGVAFKTENAILTLLWLRTFQGFAKQVR